MGLFSVLGGLIGGPFGGAIGGIVDGAASHNSKKKEIGAQNAAEMDKYVRLREAADRGGIHVLEALRAGGEVRQQTAPRLLTTLSANNSFDALEREISGEAAADRKRQRVADEIAERELENMRIATARSVFASPTLHSNMPVRTDQGPTVMSEIADPTPIDARGDIDVSIDDGGTGTQIKPRDRVVTSSGGTMDVTVGPDIDEMITGGLAEAMDSFRADGPSGPFRRYAPRLQSIRDFAMGGENEKLNQIAFDYYTRDIEQKPAIQWDGRFGYAKPDGWDQWTNKRKMAWIYHNNRSN